ncbi:uncharacterized protein LOC127844379 [Dreissena polymorpha]|uniref:uncharacterized protein LOC127844379 n=1 Tax=Dreissena polymorpha TaxID=45954 RepID=UPI00226517D9|nr:uncharacterized protein LOC127844379 [Dreissena polymorpha]
MRRTCATECRARIQLSQATLVQTQIDLSDANLAMHCLAQKRARRRRQRRWWIRAWLGPERRRQFGLYDQLMIELRREDQRAFINIMRMPPEMFDEILARVGPMITKQHRVSGSKYRDMRFGWRVPHNTISLLVPEVGRTVIDEYADDVMPLPTTAADWTRIVTASGTARISPTRLVLLMANILPANVQHDPGLRILTTKSTSPLSC